MKDDACLISSREDCFFWNEHYAISHQERQNYTDFNNISVIDVSRIRTTESYLNMETLVLDHTEMTTALREALKLNPDKTAHKKLLLATQFTFILIMNSACAIYL